MTKALSLRSPVKLRSSADQKPPLPRALRLAIPCTDCEFYFWMQILFVLHLCFCYAISHSLRLCGYFENRGCCHADKQISFLGLGLIRWKMAYSVHAISIAATLLVFHQF